MFLANLLPKPRKIEHMELKTAIFMSGKKPWNQKPLEKKLTLIGVSISVEKLCSMA